MLLVGTRVYTQLQGDTRQLNSCPQLHRQIDYRRRRLLFLPFLQKEEDSFVHISWRVDSKLRANGKESNRGIERESKKDRKRGSSKDFALFLMSKVQDTLPSLSRGFSLIVSWRAMNLLKHIESRTANYFIRLFAFRCFANTELI